MMARSRSEYLYLVNILQYLQFAGMGNALNLVVVVREDRGWIQHRASHHFSLGYLHSLQYLQFADD
jgi:hypothetical protein